MSFEQTQGIIEHAQEMGNAIVNFWLVIVFGILGWAYTAEPKLNRFAAAMLLVASALYFAGSWYFLVQNDDVLEAAIKRRAQIVSGEVAKLEAAKKEPDDLMEVLVSQPHWLRWAAVPCVHGAISLLALFGLGWRLRELDAKHRKSEPPEPAPPRAA